MLKCEMNFKLVLEKLLTAFTEQNVRYALLGGFALGLWGGSRSTVDLDFLVHRDDMDNVHRIMTSMGYERHHHTQNVSQYLSPLGVFGGVDFMHAFRGASIEMLGRSVEKDIFGGSFRIKTLIPEDIIGFKLQAVYNNPSRENADFADIETLISIHKKNLDWELLQTYFKLFEMEALYRKIREETEQ
jgi:hypothetical protein